MPLVITEHLRQDQALLTQQLDLTPAEARLDVHVLAAHACGVERVWLLAHGDECMPPASASHYEQSLARRLSGEPVAYIVGMREFYGHRLMVNADVLIPRPETELLVDLALARIEPDDAAQVLELGTGSGAIALAVALARPGARVCAVDKSIAALHMAQENSRQLAALNIDLVQSDWWAQVPPQRFDLILSNPPYIAEQDPHLKQGDVRFEPLSALAAGQDGLDDLRHIISEAPNWLKAGGWLMLEHGYDQGAAVRSLLNSAGFAVVETHLDLAGLERVSCGRKT
ncbi:MAG: peptide chain release factor N(5)-glutamine methyltransferase [Betaproteobacteria bacterium]|nr:peptide chain release factor N(5)-glutamine methyltransferase [Betaproteobacteria bacterium]